MTQNPAPDDRPWGRDARSELVERVRARDDRIPYVERAFLARQLGLSRDELEFVDDRAVDAVLNVSTSVLGVIGAEQLLRELDAHAARRHPVKLEWHHDNLIATEVPIDDGDDVVRLVLEDGVIHVTGDFDRLDDTEAENLAYALLRLVEIAREKENK